MTTRMVLLRFEESIPGRDPVAKGTDTMEKARRWEVRDDDVYVSVFDPTG
ncbi:MAG TPA: hypothetical protein VLK65_03610 [Vicinamibacteria bacterium]|nr:hypothetical protein [Vicinamibacteria bacterium]